MVTLKDIDLDLTKRLKDGEFAREYVAMVESDAAKCADRIEKLEADNKRLKKELREAKRDVKLLFT